MNAKCGKVKDKTKDKVCKKKDKVEQDDFIVRISHDPNLLVVHWL